MEEGQKEVELKKVPTNDEEDEHIDFAPPRKVTTAQQFRALFLNNVALQKRRTWTNCCQLCLPISVIVLIGIINVLVVYFLRNTINNGVGNLIQSPPVPSVASGTYPYYLYVDNSPVPLGTLDKFGNKSGILGTISQTAYCGTLSPFTACGSNATVSHFSPFFIQETDLNAANTYITNEKATYNINGIAATNLRNEQNVLPIAVLIFDLIDALLVKANYTILYEHNSNYNKDVSTPFLVKLQSPVGPVMHLINNALINYFFQGTRPTISFFYQLPLKIQFVGTLCGFLLPFALSFLLPVYVYNLVQEKQDKLREMMKMMGLSMFTYYCINFVYNFVLYAIIILLVVIIGLAFQISFFTQTSGLLLFLLFLGWGINQISFGFFISTLFSKSRTAVVVCYILVLFNILISDALNPTVFSLDNGVTANPAYLLWPAFAFYRGIYIVGNLCTNAICPPTSALTAPGNEWTEIYLILYLGSVLFLVLTWYVGILYKAK